ncbi:MAG: PadR family transcriptional regulator [Microbacteriaceae bacterium]|jgi:DNA-binding PadR family transcriptional regulator|nr:PadR family transcriptional regulator [Microbacteriaceae bacterium]
MSVRQSLLAILNQGPCYGYQLRSEFDRRTGSTSPLNVGQIYKTLDRLERDGLARKADIDGEGQIYYEITDAGSVEVKSWLGSPTIRSAASRDELVMKLAIAVTLPGVDVAEIVEVQRAATARILRDLQSSTQVHPESSEEMASRLVLDSLILALEAETRWLDLVESRVERAAAAGVATPLALNTTVPRRGRPARAATI